LPIPISASQARVGRAAAGYRGEAGDCVARAVAIATGLPYQVVYDAIDLAGKGERVTRSRRGQSGARTGVYKPTIRRYMAEIGWRWVPTMRIGSGCTVHLRAEELPAGRLVVSLSKHITAVVNGVIRDTYDPSRGGTPVRVRVLHEGGLGPMPAYVGISKHATGRPRWGKVGGSGSRKSKKRRRDEQRLEQRRRKRRAPERCTQKYCREPVVQGERFCQRHLRGTSPRYQEPAPPSARPRRKARRP
jgi:hypothetical protein